MMTEQTRIHMTFDEYWAIPEWRHPVQLIEGILFDPPRPDTQHQSVVVQVMLALNTWGPMGHIFPPRTAVILDDYNVLEPDISWIAPENKSIVSTRGIERAPDLVVEVLSSSTARYDKSVKFLLYEKHGTQEYWLIDPERSQVEVWKLEGTEFTLLGTFGANESFASATLEQTVDLAVIFAG